MKNPLVGALSASVYIIIVSTVMYFGTEFAPRNQTVLAPIAMLSLFTLSAAVMGYIFCFEPLQLFLSGKKSEGVRLFVQTVSIFSVITAAVFFVLFTGFLG